MLYCSFIELDALLSVIMIIIYGLFSLRSTQINLADVFLFCRIFPLLFVLGFYLDMSPTGLYEVTSLNKLIPTIDLLLALLLFFVMYNFQSFESILLLLFAFVGQYYMLHSIDLLTFYIALEAQNFCFLVLCGLPTVAYSKVSSKFSYGVASINSQTLNTGNGSQPLALSKSSYEHNTNTKGNYVFSVEASIKYFLLSAFSSGVLLFWFSAIYLQTGMSIFSFSPKEQSLYTLFNGGIMENEINDFVVNSDGTISVFLILCAMMFKLGAAPLHLWVVQIYNGVKRNLLLYISTAPKLSLFGFWVNSFQTVWTDYSVILFSVFSIILGAFGAYNQPSLRSLLAYSTVNEIGLLLSALETAGFNSLFQHLSIYIVSQLLLWNLYDKRLFTILAVSLAGLPPLAGFFGKVFIFWSMINVGLYSVLIVALFCTGVSLVYYLRVIRLFWNSSSSFNLYNNVKRTYLVSFCVIFLVYAPLFLIKPFII